MSKPRMMSSPGWWLTEARGARKSERVWHYFGADIAQSSCGRIYRARIDPTQKDAPQHLLPLYNPRAFVVCGLCLRSGERTTR